MTQAQVAGKHRKLPVLTERRDRWWAPPLVTFLLLTIFIAYATWAGVQGEHYHWGPYLSPFYSPEVFGDSAHAWFGPRPGWWPAWLPFSPAFLIIWAPVGFRFTCYYYRGAYYKAFWADPPNCAVGEPRKSYWGEHSFPLIIQNIHRYFLYVALGFILILSYDVYKATQFPDGFGIGLGTLILLANTTLIALYTFSCHSFRHLVGGGRDALPKGPLGKTCYDCVTGLNRRHMVFAWASFVVVISTDLYIRLLSMGVLSDWRII